MKKIRGDKPTGVIMHIHMENHKETPYSYLYLNKLKCHFFFVLSFLFLSSKKSKDRRAEQVLPGEEDWHQWEGGGMGERG
jgi:hypothetical protein